MGGRRPAAYGGERAPRGAKASQDITAYVTEVVETELGDVTTIVEANGAAGAAVGASAAPSVEQLRADVSQCNTTVAMLSERVDALGSRVAVGGKEEPARGRAPSASESESEERALARSRRLAQLQLAQQQLEQQLEVLKELHAREAARKPPRGIEDLGREIKGVRTEVSSEAEAMRAAFERQQAAVDAAVASADAARARAERAERALEDEATARRALEERLAALEARGAGPAPQPSSSEPQAPSTARVVSEVMERLVAGEGGWKGRLEALDAGVAKLNATLGASDNGDAARAPGESLARARAEIKDLRKAFQRNSGEAAIERREAQDARSLQEGALEALRERLARAEERGKALRELVGNNLRSQHSADTAAADTCRAQLRGYVGTIATEVCRVTREFVRVQMHESGRVLEHELAKHIPAIAQRPGAITAAYAHSAASSTDAEGTQVPQLVKQAAVAASAAQKARTQPRAQAQAREGKLVIEAGSDGQMATALGQVFQAYAQAKTQ